MTEAVFPTRAAAQAATIDGSVSVVILNGYANVGDSPAQRYTRISAPSPAKGYHFQSSDGQWWQLADMAIAAESVGAKGDWNGTTGTDDTAAWRDVASYITLRAGGVSVSCMPGKQYLVFPESGGTPGNVALVDLNAVHGWSIDLKGSILVTNNDFNGENNPDAYGILATQCNDIAISNFFLRHIAIETTLHSARGLVGIFLSGSTNAVISNSAQFGGKSLITVADVLPHGDATVRSSQVSIKNYFAHTVYYPFQVLFSNTVHASGGRTVNAGRSNVFQNANNCYSQVWANNGGPFDDVVIGVLAIAGASATTNTTSNITVDYYNPVRSVAPSGNDALLQLSFKQNSESTASGTLKDIFVHFDVDGTTFSSTHGIRTLKSTHLTVIPDTTPRAYIIDNIVISGTFRNWTSGKVADLFDATSWGTAGGDTVRNFIFRDLRYDGSGSSLVVNATYVNANLVFDNVVGATNLTITGVAPGVLRARNLSVPNVNEFPMSTRTMGAAISVTSVVGKTMASITLTPGDWDVWGEIYFNADATTHTIRAIASISGTDNALDSTPGRFGEVSLGTAGLPTNGQNINPHVGPYRISVGANTSIFLVAFSTFSSSSPASTNMMAWGIIQARRV